MWIERLASVLKNLVFISNKGSLNFTRPKSFNHVRDIHSVTDASELFIETPKAPFLQKLTCSEHKHHKTAKSRLQSIVQLFISVTPNSTIGFLSKAYPGSISDKRLTAESEFLDQELSYSYKMAGTRF